MKKSFLIHIDSLDVLDDLNDKQCGQLFKAIKAFQHNNEIDLDPLVKIAFSPFKNQFKRDNEKYKKTCEARAKAGSKGGKQKVANASNCKQKVANLAENKNKTKNKSDNNNNNEFDLVWDMYGKKGNKKTSLSKFTNLKDSEKKLMAKHLPEYIKSKPEKQYRKNLETYINQECWNDEIEDYRNEKTTTSVRAYETPTDRSRIAADKLRRQQEAYTENATPIQTNDRLIR